MGRFLENLLKLRSSKIRRFRKIPCFWEPNHVLYAQQLQCYTNEELVSTRYIAGNATTAREKLLR